MFVLFWLVVKWTFTLQGSVANIYQLRIFHSNGTYWQLSWRAPFRSLWKSRSLKQKISYRWRCFDTNKKEINLTNVAFGVQLKFEKPKVIVYDRVCRYNRLTKYGITKPVSRLHTVTVFFWDQAKNWNKAVSPPEMIIATVPQEKKAITLNNLSVTKIVCKKVPTTRITKQKKDKLVHPKSRWNGPGWYPLRTNK